MPHQATNGKRAFLTGITGQDGSYLAELLLDKGDEVWGMVRRSSSFNRGRIDHLCQDPALHESASIWRAVTSTTPRPSIAC